MRWAGQTVGGVVSDPDALPGLQEMPDLVRTVRTPEFAGVTFHEVLARSALNHVPTTSDVPFAWTINPYRGCTHGCVYCFARQTHSYLDLDTGRDFDAEIVVKVNVAEVLAREVARPTWCREPVALGTNTDPYQRAEGRYRLMPAVVEALAGSGTPFSILTKGTTLRRDLPLLADAATRVPVMLGVSLALLDEEVQTTLEPGVPSPRARLELVRSIRAAGLPCQVLVAPVLPYLTDSDDHLERVVGAVAEAGATSASVMALHLRPGAREWFLRWLGEHHPDLVDAYAELYRGGSYVLRSYASDLAERARPVLRRHGLDRPSAWRRPGRR
jgi:DNA repair photolyase